MATKVKITLEKNISTLKLQYLAYMQKWKEYKEVIGASVSDRQLKDWASLGHQEAQKALEYRQDRKAMTKIAIQLDTLTNQRGQ